VMRDEFPFTVRSMDHDRYWPFTDQQLGCQACCIL